MNSKCPKSEYKDERHEWHGQNVVGSRVDLELRYCVGCERVEVQQLMDSGGQPGDVYETIAVGYRKKTT